MSNAHDQRTKDSGQKRSPGMTDNHQQALNFDLEAAQLFHLVSGKFYREDVSLYLNFAQGTTWQKNRVPRQLLWVPLVGGLQSLFEMKPWHVISDFFKIFFSSINLP